ncbi:hypothetical protein GGH94_006154 [Coemansia aciculifera]|uniref:Uncharacterized protein n=1 Tax=Coemansia aciculifera TaxID=417176 RepID=A0A9W8ICF0_9FUNG|nr:hypothetical protein GGH94_006154 [Coemansia aciculifera]
MHELASSRGNISVPAPSSDSVLQLVFDYLSPVPGPGCRSKELLVHLRRLQIMAAVNREWRAAALPLLYRTAYVVIGSPLDPRDVDDSDDGDMTIDDEDQSEEEDDDDESDDGDDDNMGTGDEGQSEEGNDCISIGDEEQSEVDSVGRGDAWDSDDEGLLSTPGLSQNAADTSVNTNIGLIHDMGQTGNVREVHTIVQGMGLTADQLYRHLQLAGLGEESVWPVVERLRIDMHDSGTLNHFLSTSLPSLREIEFYGPHSKAIYGCELIEQLIKERLHRLESLRAVRVKSDCWPKLTDDYSTGEAALLVCIECMEIDGPDETYLMPVPIMMADTLVELKLVPMIKWYEWKLFEHFGDLYQTESGSHTSKPPLPFSSLKSLVLSLVNIEDVLKPGSAESNDLCRSMYGFMGNSDDLDEENENKVYLEDIRCQLDERFEEFPDYNKPKFPVLTSLEFRYLISRSDLQVFAASPISSLTICNSMCFTGNGLNLSIFRRLRSPSVRLTSAIDVDGLTRVNKALSTVRPTLQRLTLAMNLKMSSQLRFSVLSFSDSLISLTLESEFGQHDVEHFLQLFPNLRRLRVCAIFSEPGFSQSELIDKYRCANATQSLMPINSLLRVLEAYGVRYFSGYDGWNCIPGSKRLMAPELDHYRGMLIGLVCRLPTLEALRVGAKSLDGVNECIRVFLESNIAPEHIDFLRRLRIQPLDY